MNGYTPAAMFYWVESAEFSEQIPTTQIQGSMNGFTPRFKLQQMWGTRKNDIK